MAIFYIYLCQCNNVEQFLRIVLREVKETENLGKKERQSSKVLNVSIIHKLVWYTLNSINEFHLNESIIIIIN